MPGSPTWIAWTKYPCSRSRAPAVADIAKSRKVLGFSPKISLEDGIEKFLSWYNDYYK
jgi:nucleoside-diphosphate-sugar epimerase